LGNARLCLRSGTKIFLFPNSWINTDTCSDIRDSRVAFLLGAGTANDAYTIAYRIPNLFRRLIGEGAVSAVFIPVFSRYLAADKKKEAWEFANAILTVMTIFLAALTVAGVVFSPLLVRFFASGFAETPGKLELTATLNRIMFPYIFLISLSALSMGILNSLQKFGRPAFAPVLLNLSIVVFSFLGGLFGDVTKPLAVGVVVGGLFQLGIQIPPLVRAGWRMRLKLDLSHPGVQSVAKTIGPVIFGVGIVQVNMLVDSQFASYLSEGSVTSIYIADRVMELVLGSYAVAVSTAILPLLSRQAAVKQLDEMKNTINFAARVVLFITIPATVGLVLLRHEIIEVLFQHGDFDAASTTLTAWPLLFFALGLSAISMIKIAVPAFYALEDIRTPVKIGFFSLILNIVLNALLIGPLENGGPALATSIAAFFNAITLLYIFRKRFGPLGIHSVLRSTLKFLIASAGLGVVTYVMIHWPGFYAGQTMQKAISLAATIAAGAGIYFVLAHLMRSRELAELRDVKRAVQ
jgi:putative peptidoglycan lipid II flippase